VQRRHKRIRVPWVDTDASGRIHYTAAFRWVELAEIELFRDHNLMADRNRYPRRNVEAEFLGPIEFDDELDIELSVDRIGRSSLTFKWSARKVDEVVARGSQTIVYVDGAGQSTALPEAVRQRLQ
jgi:acyl-CoA thioester hydrolase